MNRRLVLLVAVAAAFVLCAGCGAIRATFDTDQALHRAGFRGASVTAHINNGFTTVEVQGIESGDAERAAGIVWQTFRYRIDSIVAADRVFSRGQSRELFGPRNPDYDRRTFGGELTRLGKAALFGAGITGFIVAALLVALIFVFVRRGRRANAAAFGG